MEGGGEIKDNNNKGCIRAGHRSDVLEEDIPGLYYRTCVSYVSRDHAWVVSKSLARKQGTIECFLPGRWQSLPLLKLFVLSQPSA